MLKNYFRTAWRSLLKDRQFSLLNLLGLATGLACALLIYLWVSDELQVDHFFKNDDRLYRIMENRVKTDGIWTAPSSPGPMADAMKADFPEVQYAVTERRPSDHTLSIPQKDIIASGKFTGKDFFQVFSYELLYGNPGQVLTDKHSIVLSERLAMQLFNTTRDLIGKTIEFEHRDQYTVSGIFKNPPASATEQFDYLLPFAVLYDTQDWLRSWGNTGCFTYVLLKPGTDVNRFNSRLAGYIKAKTNNEIKHRTPFASRYSENYLYGNYENGVVTGGRISYVKMFSIIAIFLIVIACINFMNLSTARAAGRMKEIGVKKVMGAGRSSLALQYLGESVLLTLIAFLFSLLLVVILLPFFNTITGKQLVLTWSPGMIASFLLIVLITGLIAGSYPALYLSGFKPVAVLKGRLMQRSGELWIRKGLVVFQFTISAILIISVIVVYKQIAFIQSKNLGYNRDHVITFDREGVLDSASHLEAFINQVNKLPDIVSATYIGHNMTGHNGGTYGIQWPGRAPNDQTEFESVATAYDVLPTMGFEMKEGRAFAREFPSDSNAILFNEAGIRFMGMKDPVGKKVVLWGEPKTIIGVVKDFHFESLHEQVKPLFFYFNPDNSYLVAVRIKAGHTSAAIAALENLYRDFNPGFPLNYRFLDEGYQKMYAAEARTGVLSRYFAGLAIIISCLGLFGLAAFTAQKRQKEISIRKVLGANTVKIVRLLAAEFLALILIANLIAIPVAAYAMSRWLSGFAYRTAITGGIFIIAGISAVLIALLVIGSQAVKAAVINPVQSLRNE